MSRSWVLTVAPVMGATWPAQPRSKRPRTRAGCVLKPRCPPNRARSSLTRIVCTYVFEALPSAIASTVREHASMQETRDMWKLCLFPSEAAESLYGAVPRDISSGIMTPVTTSRGTGFSNLGVNACFVNASVQCMLRVGPVAALLAAHVSAHQIEDHVCVACAMGRLATAIQDHAMTTSSAKVSSCYDH